MTTRELGFVSPPVISVLEGASTPDPGLPGVRVWSPSTGVPMYWTGTVWTAGPGGSGAASATAVTLNVSTVAINYTEVVVADAVVTVTSKIQASFVASLDAENDVEELADSNMSVYAIPEAGQIRFVLTGNGAFTGPFPIIYEVLQ